MRHAMSGESHHFNWDLTARAALAWVSRDDRGGVLEQERLALLARFCVTAPRRLRSERVERASGKRRSEEGKEKQL